MPSGSASSAASTKPPRTRHTVMPMSKAKPICVSSTQPLFTIVSASARKVLPTKPPSVAIAQTATKATKNAMPSASRGPAAIGTSGFMPPSLDEARVGELRKVGHLLDDAGFHQQLGGVLVEGHEVAGEELAVRLSVLPAQVLLRSLELLSGLLHVGAHDVEALLRILLDHVDRV